MIVLDAGAAWASAPDGSGVVRAVFSRAIHVEIDAELLVIVGPPSPAGPLHLRLEPLPVGEVGATWSITDGWVRLGATTVDLRAAPRWTPPPVERPARAAPLANESALADDADLLASIAASLRTGDLADVAGRLGGRGPGLTPAGDDVLAGVVLTLHAGGFDEAALRAAVEKVRTTDLAHAYLRWAARGQSIAPAHELLRALGVGDDAEITRASAALCGHGASSGADLLLGISLALTHLAATRAARGPDELRTGAGPARRP